ncbi:MAG: UDP-N-acetylglucosamine--N-acetylmuramyl-(pentapeptide) pyrophosphoryl-undecaprenol N-acetylglucosamine transferase [Actinomycetia bacterium]|nr:UDP-N-acetylglucosamine--N-acetylmuramyl-(pentapeptide) pyrophosphoryl-undecaprenol N-acetylglucosamine transferase [Actinomycetes bacterium]MCP5034361.1 UDP-N-acetylglucosamine--N-acetylmuramyl-(pentapeptide) pyrophosphoryl-undecaprenol N-acetylglucosamine transferase [Actinomycetes bacterium]
MNESDTTTTSDDPSGRRWRRRFVITGGGTAGHTNPGIAVAEALVRAGISAEQVHFVGGQRGNERTLVPEAGFSIDLLPGRGIERRISLASIGAVFSLIAGVVKGFWLVLRHRPMVVLCLGGYAAFAVSMAAVILRVPLVVTEQNAKASAVNRLMGRFAKVCALPFPGTDLPKGVVTGNPSLAAVVESVASGDVGRARDDLGLPRDRVVIGVFSGSLGATSVNSATRDLAERWADRSDLAIRHVIGRRDWDEFSTPPPAIAAGDLIYQVVEYETEMPKLLVAADLAISRAGASTVAELAIAGVPSVLVPLPIAPRGAQRANAEELVAAGGAIVVVDDELDAERLVVELGPLVNDGESRMKMADAAAAVARPDAADHVAELLLEAANHPLGRKQ